MLIDCDNFFVSCERIFQPHLKNIPVVVLSNNDGCVVSRSYEAKALAIPMCIPFFKIEKFFKQNGGVALSSNYELYADISQRMMSLLRSYFTKVEPYSIDEAFVETSESTGLLQMATNLRQTILQQIGIPVSIGIAKSKTLCKIAADYAKKHDKVFCLNDQETIDRHLTQIEVIDIWGIGRHLAPRLNYLGIFNAYELTQTPLKMIRQSFGVNLERTILELKQFPCMEISRDETAKSIISSRSFESEIADKFRLQQIIAEFVDDACQRLRRQNAVARGLMVELRTNRFNKNVPFYQNSRLICLDEATSNTSRFMSAMQKGLEYIFRPGLHYKQAGVMLTGIENRQTLQPDLLSRPAQNHKEQKLMAAFDQLNQKMGRKTVFFANQAAVPKPFLKRGLKSPRFTTCWAELLTVH